MNKPLIIFDLDGTLLDTQASLARAFNLSLAELEAPQRDVSEFRYIIGDGAKVAARRCLPEERQSNTEIERCLAGFKKHYERTWSEAQPYEGIVQMLDAVSGSAQLAVLSNKDDAFTQKCISHYFPGKFDHVVGFREEFGLKPDPSGARYLMRQASANEDNVVIVGDMAIDMNTASACNVTGVGVLWGFRDEPELSSAGARHIVAKPSELVRLVAKIS